MSSAAPPDDRRGQNARPGLVWPSVVAILFATLSVISFAVDHSVTLSLPADPPASDGTN